MLLNLIGRFLYWTALTLQLTSVQYCKMRKRYVQHRWFCYKVLVSLAKISLLSLDIPDVALMVITAHRMEFKDNILNFLLLGQCFLWLSRLYSLMALICMTHLSYYQRRIIEILNKMLDISKELENSHSEKHISFLLLMLLAVGIFRLMLDIWTKLGLIVHLTCTIYYNTLFSLWYLGLGVYQTQLVEWRKEMVMVLREFTENGGHHSRVEVDRLMSCVRINYCILELQMSFCKIWNAFFIIIPLLLLNFVDLWSISSLIHFVSILILCQISDEGRRWEDQFINLLFVASLRSGRGDTAMSQKDPLKVYETAIIRHFESVSSKQHLQLSNRSSFWLSQNYIQFAALFYLVLKANNSIEKLSQLQLRYDNDDEEFLND